MQIFLLFKILSGSYLPPFVREYRRINQHFVFSLLHIPCNMLSSFCCPVDVDTVVFCRFGEKKDWQTRGQKRAFISFSFILTVRLFRLLFRTLQNVCACPSSTCQSLHGDSVFLSCITSSFSLLSKMPFFHFPYSQLLDDFLHLSYRLLLSSIDFVHSHFSILGRFSSFLSLFEKNVQCTPLGILYDWLCIGSKVFFLRPTLFSSNFFERVKPNLRMFTRALHSLFLFFFD